MFPQIARDDVFRIETSRLWLRWPTRHDCDAIKSYASYPEVADMTSTIPHPYPDGEAEHFVERVREKNSCGETLELLIVRKSSPQYVIGTVLLRFMQSQKLVLGYAIHPDHWGQGYATEAAKALIDVAFLLVDVDEIDAIIRLENTASRCVLKNLGFKYIGDGSNFVPLRKAVQLLEEYQLTRMAYHAAFGGALSPLIWEDSCDRVQWAGAV